MKFSPLILAAAFCARSALADEPPVPAKIEFNRDVRPILSDTCFKCHGPDPKTRDGGRRLDLRDGALAEIDGVRAVVPGDLKASELHVRIHSTDKDEVMPSPKSGKKLTARQKVILDKWIEQGAEYQEHWSYIKPVRPAVPEVRGSGQPVRNPIDAFVQARLVEQGLKPSPEADARTLARRLSFDLIGLPPKPGEVAAFADGSHGTHESYGRLVDALLASPHYGERMAIPWLDVVRFADTIGYHSDNPRNVWPYRDYVIRAFNENKPFDRFTIEQLAGDLLANSTQEQKIGSAFNRLLLTTEEGGAQAKDYEARMLTDRVRAVGTVWLGHTVGCAQCHDHKYDPITTRDFYALGAFFADIKEGSIGKREDGMLVVSKEQEAQLAKLDAAQAEAKKKLDAVTPQLDAAQQQWEADVRSFEATLPELRKDSKASEADKTAARKAQDALKKEAKARNAKDKDAIRDYFRDKATVLFRTELDGVAKAKTERDAFYNPLPKCIVSIHAEPRTVRILPRGNWMDESGEVMKPALPKFLASAKADHPLTRLDLAQWLVSRDNPLTARVFVNRLWKQFFGTGLSKVLDDLGAQGEPPVHPALLDWLAVEFMESGWDVKHMVRLIVTSHTYWQVSTAPKEWIARDPDNRDLARQSRFRLDAELVRDNALSIAGLLVPKIGGPSVKPYQPAGYWENLNFPVREWQNDTNENQWRRGLYTWWQRSYLQPSLLAFDAPTREECAAERVRSNIPQQALALLNDPTYVEAARAFAARILKEGGESAAERIEWAYRQALGRAPREDEASVIAALLEKHLALYANDASAAERLIKTGLAPVTPDVTPSELAAWTNVARVILNLHETITRS